MYDKVNELARQVATHSLGHDRWGRTYWSFNSLPNLYIQRLDKDLITQPTDLDSSLHSEKVCVHVFRLPDTTTPSHNGCFALCRVRQVIEGSTTSISYEKVYCRAILEAVRFLFMY